MSLRSGERQNALWGRRGENRGNALWGSGKRGILLLAVAATMIVPVAGSAAPRSAQSPARTSATTSTTLLELAAANPDQVFDVIVQTHATGGKSRAAEAIAAARSAHPGKAQGLKRQFTVISGGAAQLTGAQIVDLAARQNVVAITLDAPMTASGSPTSICACPYEGVYWPYITGVTGFWQKPGAKATPAPQAPAIALVDSGIDAGNSFFGGRVVKEVSLTSLTPNAAGDGRGHGTLVAGLAAGMSGNWGGASPTSKLVSLDVLNDKGQGLTSGVLYAPANDPFVITVGALDVHGTQDLADDYASPWSAYGSTLDGFSKPELGAPGRYMIGAVPTTATMPLQRPDRIVAPGFMWMSGTSFAAPVVAGAAADLLALHPSWTPDQVKGALMSSAKALPSATPGSAGVGELKLDAAALITAPPNPNLALDSFLSPDPLGSSTPVFDAASWAEAARANAAWDSASWAEASWSAASWAEASWSDASWATASWAEASWAEASWAEASWAAASWADLVW